MPPKEPKAFQNVDVPKDNFVKVGENDGSIPITLGDAEKEEDILEL